jgi:excisionase family DNA binding protein
MDKLLLSPAEAAAHLSIGRSKVYELMRLGQLRSVKIGASRRIPQAALVDFIAALAEEPRLRAAATRIDPSPSRPLARPGIPWYGPGGRRTSKRVNGATECEVLRKLRDSRSIETIGRQASPPRR